MKKYYCLINITILLLSYNVSAQDFEKEFNGFQKDIKKEFSTAVDEQTKEFNDFIDRNNKEFDDFIKKMDDEFYEDLKKEWKEFECLQGEAPDKLPKPDNVPTFNKDKHHIKNSTVDVTEKPKSKSIEVPPIPVVPVKQDIKAELNSQQITFFGTTAEFKFDKKLLNEFNVPDNEKIREYWLILCKSDYSSLIRQLLNYKEQLNLNDWGYYLLIRELATKLHPNSDNSSTLLTWFLLNKSKYKARIGYHDNKIGLLLPALNEIYNVPYYIFKGEKYYSVNYSGEKLYTYEFDYPYADLIMDLNIRTPVNLNVKEKTRVISFNYNNITYELPVKYNENYINFCKDYPNTDIKIYFNSALTATTRESLINCLAPLLKDRKENEAVSMLLNFVQTAFSYKTDQEQFGNEKFFFPEEIFHYDYSDCEDRAVLFTALIRELLGLKSIGLDYTGHIATAVNLPPGTEGKYLFLDNKKYIVCDPTYKNAPVGFLLPEYENQKPGVIRIGDEYNRKKEKRDFWNLTLKAGGYPSDNSNNIIFDKDSNLYITGHFINELVLDSVVLVSDDTSTEAFVSKFNKNHQIIWAKKIYGKGFNSGNAITLDHNGNCYVTGSFESTFQIDNKVVKSNAPDLFLIKLDGTGKLIWARELEIDMLSKENARNFIAQYDPGGNLLYLKLDNLYFTADNYSLNTDTLGNCYITGSLYHLIKLSKDIRIYKDGDEFDVVSSLIGTTDKPYVINSPDAFSGVYSALSYINTKKDTIKGNHLQKIIELSFNNTANKNIYSELENIYLINHIPIVSAFTSNQQPAIFDIVQVNNNSKFKITMYDEGAKIDILTGIQLGNIYKWYDLNYIMLLKDNNEILFDYDNHYRKKLTMKSDIL
jgi:hypothetical protein